MIKYFQMIIVDNYHKVSTKGEGDNYHLNLDGILFLGTIYNFFLSQYNFIACYISIDLMIQILASDWLVQVT